ncbi:MAG: MerR family transcriptional regulator [Luteolibacter sp.]
MKLVSLRTGLSPHVLRVWERRYEAVTPQRSNSNQRIYREEEVNRLEMLARLTKAGHGIGQIAGLPIEELELMDGALPRENNEVEDTADSAEELLDEAWKCVATLDPAGLRLILDKAAVLLGISGLLTQLLVPLIGRVGMGWESGNLSIAEEHAASAVIREALLLASRPFADSSGAPLLLVTTPSGQLHELGADLVSALARQLGWDVTYLGPSLPAIEIARAVERTKPTALALSIVYPGDDPLLSDELRRLKRLLPPELPILIGGGAASSYATAIQEIGARSPADLDVLKTELANIRERRTRAMNDSRSDGVRS